MGKAFKATIFLSLICLLLGFYLGQNVGAGTAPAPGSADDPLVSRSWVESYINQALQSGGLPEVSPPAPFPSELSKFRVVELQTGQKLLLGESTEMILRAGDTRALEGSGGGLSNLTSGKNITAGQVIPLDNLILSPREDGRGLDARSHAIVLIRGSYRIS